MEDLKERITNIENKLNSKIGWMDLIATFFVFGIIVGLFGLLR